MPHKRLDCEEWCCQHCKSFSDQDYNKVVYHEITKHHYIDVNKLKSLKKR